MKKTIICITVIVIMIALLWYSIKHKEKPSKVTIVDIPAKTESELWKEAVQKLLEKPLLHN